MAQVERVINIISQAEHNIAEKMKIALMEEASATGFLNLKHLKSSKKQPRILQFPKSRVPAKSSEDSVQEAFIEFFYEKAEAAYKEHSGEEFDFQCPV
mmetsp:Transcript_21634/g.24648  ORF Transcript_21634/g.24648 Transcript_21634/m.24648 type:complete len:98 (-) Transcript_21634:44-337(-)